MLFLKKLPIFIILLIFTAFIMFIPSIFGVINNEYEAARSFFYYGLLILLISFFLAVASLNRAKSSPIRSQLLIVISSFVILPIFFMLPLLKLLPNFDAHSLYFEMVSAFTTTGLTGLYMVEHISSTVLFWQVLVAWFGGVFIWTLYLAIFNSLGINNIFVTNEIKLIREVQFMEKRQFHHSEVFLKTLFVVLVPYTALTIMLWGILKLSGDSTFVSLSHSMSTMSTSGISPIGGISSDSGVFGLLAILLFLFFALSSGSYRFYNLFELKKMFAKKSEFEAAIYLIFFSTLVLTVLNLNVSHDFNQIFILILENIFLCISFLTTTGWFIYFSPNEPSSVLSFILIALTFIGGGIGTTAGGLKLIRFAIMQRHLNSEMTRMVYPSQIRISTSRMNLNSSIILKVWVFAMILVITILFIFCLLTIVGMSFENAFIMSISALCNNGPLFSAIIQPLDLYLELTVFSKYIIICAMILGRIEILLLFALFNPELWGK